MWAALALLLVSPALAHPAQATALLVDVGADRVQLSVEIPRDQLGMALRGSPVAEGPLPPDAALSAYVLDHLSVTAGGRTLPEQVVGTSWEHRDGQPTLVVAVDLPAAGADLSVIDLEADLLIHTVASHKAYVYLRRDAAQGQLGEAQVLGVLKRGQTQLQLDRTSASPARAVAAAARMGAQHIAEGVDHLVFLLCLVAVAPLRATRSQGWAPSASHGASLRRLVGVVTAFTLGHSATLALAALGHVQLPSAPVELLVGLSVAVTAAHVLRPLFFGREPLVAGAFGLVHGLAFASALTGWGFDRQGLALTLAGFNLGVEAAQLLVVAATLPVLALATRVGAGEALRRWAGITALLLAAAWVVERAAGWVNPVEDWPLISAGAGAVGAVVWGRLRSAAGA